MKSMSISFCLTLLLSTCFYLLISFRTGSLSDALYRKEKKKLICRLKNAFLLKVVDAEDPSSDRALLRGRVTGDDPELKTEERSKIREFLDACPDEN